MEDSLNILPNGFYRRSNVVEIARKLLGKILYTDIDGHLCSAKIVETEAYCGREDRACHAYNGRRTKRTEVMYQAGGCAYVYLCYGIHHLFNVVTNVEGLADAVLIRAVEPIIGLESMKKRSKNSKNRKMTNGPGVLSRALGITTNLSGQQLNNGNICIVEGKKIANDNIVATTRIGVGNAGEDALLPWRFYIKDNSWVSKF